MWITVIPHPYETGDESTPGDEVYEVKATAQGLVSIAEADLPSEYAEDGTYFVLLTHDLSNDYAGFGEGASLSTNGFLDTSHEDGLSIDGTDADGNDLITSHSSSITVQESAQVSLGSLYPVRYTDTPLVEPDTDEPNDDRASAGSVTSIGTAYPRTLGWDDVDWFEFVPTVTDEYRVVVADNPYNPDDEDELDLEFPVRLSVYVYDSGSGGIAHMGSDYDDDSTSADDYGLVDTWLQAGEQYYFEVSSPAKTDVGDYVLKVIPAEIAYDVDEPSNDDHVPGGGTEVPFGYDNYLDRTAHKHDTDYFWLDTAGLMESNLTFAIETEPGPGETQTLDLTPSVLIYDEDAMELYHVGSNYDGGFADNYRNNLQPDQRYELRIRNNSSSSIDYYQPTGAYRLRFLYGPDYWDYDTTNDRPYAYGETDDVISYSSMDTLYDGSTSYHTIYRTDDVDFIEINTGSNTSVTITLSVAEAYSDGIWSNDFYADFDVYNPAAAEYATSLTSNGSGSFTLDSGDGLDGSNQTWYIRVFRASNSPIPTGAYKITVTGS